MTGGRARTTGPAPFALSPTPSPLGRLRMTRARLAAPCGREATPRAAPAAAPPPRPATPPADQLSHCEPSRSPHWQTLCRTAGSPRRLCRLVPPPRLPPGSGPFLRRAAPPIPQPRAAPAAARRRAPPPRRQTSFPTASLPGRPTGRPFAARQALRGAFAASPRRPAYRPAAVRFCAGQRRPSPNREPPAASSRRPVGETICPGLSPALAGSCRATAPALHSPYKNPLAHPCKAWYNAFACSACCLPMALSFRGAQAASLYP